MENIVNFIKKNRSFFYEDVQSHYRQNYFKDNGEERHVLLSINDSNCRYNACLLYSITYLRRHKNIRTEAILTTYSERFLNFVIRIFTNAFFQDSFTEGELEVFEEHSRDFEESIIMYLFEDETFFSISHMMTHVEEGNRNLLIDAYGNGNYKRRLEIREFDKLKCSAYLPKDECLNKADIPHHSTKDAILIELPYEYLEQILKPGEIYKQVLGGRKKKIVKSHIKKRKSSRKRKSNKRYTRKSLK